MDKASMARVTVCIPTMNRPEDLARCLSSVMGQSALPAEVVIIDDGNLDQNAFRKMVEPRARFVYFKKSRPSSAASKNLARKLASSGLILVLDDDTILERGCIEELVKRFEWDGGKAVGGVSGVITNRKKKSVIERVMRRLFLLENGNPGRILPWGFQTGYYHAITVDREVQWTSSCCTCYRRELLEEFSFREFQGGRTALEDIDFCWRASKKYRFMVTPAARLQHNHSRSGREAVYRTGFKQAYNRLWIFRRHSGGLKNSISFCWATLGHVLGMAFTGRLGFAAGNIAGTLAFLKKGARR